MIDLFLTDLLHVTAFLAVFLLTLICGPIFIPMLHKLKYGQTVRDDGPKSHLVKTGTPTIGGIIFLIPIAIISIFIARGNPGIIPLVLVTLGFGAIGFADDLIKVVKKRKDGLYPWQKLFLLVLLSTAFAVYISNFTDIGNDIIIPFLGVEFTFDLNFAFIPFAALVLIASTNSVNLTDGLDGLAAGVTFIVALLFTLVAGADAQWHIPGVFSAMIAGGCLGFLAFNLHPAKVFMGDAGSLALGGAIGAVAIVMKMPLVLIIAGGIYAAEAISDIIQVLYFKKTGKRVFKMAPLHHHFELSGWKETKVVAVFWAVTLILCVIAFLSLGLEVRFNA